MPSAVAELLARSRGPAGDPVALELDADSGPLAELAELLSRANGFAVFNAGLQVYRAGTPGVGPELEHWNAATAWKDTYGGLADGVFCFAQDLFGVQFAVVDGARVVSFDPETAQQGVIGESLEAWAAWLLADPDVRAPYRFATAWQDEHGALGYDQRLVPWQPFALGGEYSFANVVAKDAVECMRIRGPVAQRMHALPEGARLSLRAE